MTQSFVETLREHFEANLVGTNSLQRMIRQKAWDRFVELGLPNKFHAGYQYFPFLSFYKELHELTTLSKDATKGQFESRIFPECRNSYIVFVNGQFVPELSDTSALHKKVVVLRLKDALDEYGNFIQERIVRALKEESDPFATLNIALIQMGLFLYVPPQTEVDVPLQCLHLLATDRPTLMTPRIHLHMGARSKLRLISDVHCLKDYDYFNNGVTDIAIEEGAQLEHYGMISPCKHGWFLDAIRVEQKRDSTYRSVMATSGSHSVRQDIKVTLSGENANCDLQGVSLLSENRQSHVNVLIEHKAPHCTSNQLFKNILEGTSRSSFEGKIYVHPEAQKTVAYQLNNNLILSARASANSKPNLEIFADDVKASHGATVTQLDQKHLFYLTSRGIPPKEAKNLLLLGFSTDILQNIAYRPIRDRMLRIAKRYVG